MIAVIEKYIYIIYSCIYSSRCEKNICNEHETSSVKRII